MKEFLSNSWVVSIISGILVFFVTNFFVILKSKRESTKQILIKDIIGNIYISNDNRKIYINMFYEYFKKIIFIVEIVIALEIYN